ncbi:MAG TPA: DUF1566 domain-containing protein [Polyangiales bacterium]
MFGSRPGAGALVLLPWLAACNALLGIDPPKEQMLTDEQDASLDGDELVPDASAEPTPQISDEEPSAYAWAAWRMPNPPAVKSAANPQTFGVRAAGIVVDTITKLEWQQKSDEVRRTRADAEAYCEELSLNKGGFRLPSRIELLSLVDFTRSNPSLDASAFPSAPVGPYWSSSRYAGDSGWGWLVNFEFGTNFARRGSEDTEALVRCVR